MSPKGDEACRTMRSSLLTAAFDKLHPFKGTWLLTSFTCSSLPTQILRRTTHVLKKPHRRLIDIRAIYGEV